MKTIKLTNEELKTIELALQEYANYCRDKEIELGYIIKVKEKILNN